jgi:uncharacterized repeat protein (TIGR01451 family)
MFRSTHYKLVVATLLALSPLAMHTPAMAAGTAANTTVSNLATVNYQVGGLAQPAIGSSPTGNTAGAGTATTFLVDNKIDLTVIETSGAATTTSPALANVVTQFKLTNTGNFTQGYTLAATNLSGTTLFTQVDNFDQTNLRPIVSGANCVTTATVTPAYAGETASSVATLAADSCVYIFILADTPATSGAPAHPVNGDYANVRLTATTVAAVTLATINETTTGDTAAVDIVFADSATGGQVARDARAFADDQYAVQSATLSVQKTSAVISDPFNGTTNPKAIPGAVVEYTIVVSNTGATAATNVSISDLIPANTTASLGQYGGAGLDIQQQTGAGANTTCTASNADADGCEIAAGTLTVTIANVLTGAANNRTVRFRVTIN